MKTLKAFTLVELLVVIAIIGVLVALLLPAVQAAREAARRMQCSNNLKQLGIALHNYHDTILTFPPGGFDCNNSTVAQNRDTNGNGLSWNVMILPFMELGSLYDQFDFHPGNFNASFGGVNRLTPSLNRVNGFLCPSWNEVLCLHGSSKVGNEFTYLSHYYGSGGPAGACQAPEGSNPYYATEHSTFGIEWINTRVGITGILPYRIALDMSAITDGTSNTLMIGEMTGRGRSLVPASVTSWWDYCMDGSSWARGWGNGSTKNLWMTFNTIYNGYARLPYSSHHANVVQFVKGDGSVSGISDTTDLFILRRLASRNDGVPQSLP